MSKPGPGDKNDFTIRGLYPQLSNQQLEEIEEILRRYLELALRIYERIKADPEAYSQFRELTASKNHHTMHGEGSDLPSKVK